MVRAKSEKGCFPQFMGGRPVQLGLADDAATSGQASPPPPGAHPKLLHAHPRRITIKACGGVGELLKPLAAARHPVTIA